MAAYEARGKTDEHYTPWVIFDALGEVFDLDVAAPTGIKTCVPARMFLTSGGLTTNWSGFVWMNMPFGHQKNKRHWLRKFFDHGNGVALSPDRTSAPWFTEALNEADAHLNCSFKPKYWTIKNGQLVRGEGPGTGTTLFASGDRAVAALRRAASRGLGNLHTTVPVPEDGERVSQPKRGDASWADEVARAQAFLESRL